MTQEEKELLINDLGARLACGVKCEVCFKDAEGYKIIDMSLKGVFTDECYFTTESGSIYSSNFKPYLRPLSSMTEEEIIEFNNIPSTKNYTIIENDLPWDVAHYKQIDWLNQKMFDYRGLIPKGLAIEATEDMYNK